jgi:DDE superfamily endonuclease/Helix-turn-helix of DDE superfamily endonuclease
MSLRYNKVKNNPTIFKRLFGVSVNEFERIFWQVEPLWQKRVVGRYKRPGRDYKLELTDRLLMLLLYYRTYTTQIFVGYLFGIDDSQVCRNIRTLEPILAKVMAITKTRHLKQEEIEDLIIDATEQPIERPKKGQKAFYSGKKKRHTNKTEIRIIPQGKGRIVHVSRTRPGSVHDFAVFKEEPPIPKETTAFVDLGYQGLDRLHSKTELPFKASKNKPLDSEDKAYNHALSRIRIKVENVLASIKVFRILSDPYRNKNKRYNLKFNIIAGIVNLKNGFSSF